MSIAMITERYRFKVGSLDCLAVSDGTFTYTPPMFPPPANFLFANASKEHLSQVLDQHNIDTEKWVAWTSPYICLFIETKEHRVLIDTGAGRLGPETGRLLQNLKLEGIFPRDIDTVIITHGHPDHIGGNTINGGKPVFDNARYVISRDEWNFWTSSQAESKLDEHAKALLLPLARRSLQPIQEQISLVDEQTEIVPGIRAVLAPGHTPGHIALAISSAGKQLLCISDTFLHPMHVEHPDWHTAVDIDPQQVIATRHRLLQLATAENTLVFAFHFPFPGLGQIIQKGEGWKWKPIRTFG